MVWLCEGRMVKVRWMGKTGVDAYVCRYTLALAQELEWRLLYVMDFLGTEAGTRF